MMNRKTTKMVVFALLVAIQPALSAPPKKQQRSAEPIIAFGIIVSDEGEQFKETNIVPRITDQCYGWIIDLDSQSTSVKLKEVFELPVAPPIWDYDTTTGQLSEDRTVLVTEKEIIVDNGRIENFWCVAEGDPVGDYTIRVYVNDRPIETFHFTVVDI